TDEGQAERATTERDQRAEEAKAARSAETDARLVLRTVEERLKAITSRAESLEHAADTERKARAAAEEQARRRAEQSQIAAAVQDGAARAIRAIEGSLDQAEQQRRQDRKSTRLNSSHVSISYAVFCLKKKTPTFSI